MISVFLNFSGPPSAADRARAQFTETALPGLAAAARLRFVDIYQPAAGEVPAFQDGTAAPLLVELNLESLDDASRLIESTAFNEARGMDELGHDAATVDVFQPVHYPVPGNAQPPPRTAPLSFVVRYFGPVDNEADFVSFYTRNHPPLLARFPGIRNVLCYLPVRIDLPGTITTSGSFLGNEVVFDSLDALNAALASDVLELVKADGRRFAKFGHNTHHAMYRATVFRGVDP